VILFFIELSTRKVQIAGIAARGTGSISVEIYSSVFVRKVNPRFAKLGLLSRLGSTFCFHEVGQNIIDPRQVTFTF
jgi:hypothetical protein